MIESTLKKEENESKYVTLNVDCWITKRKTVHEIWLKDPNDDVNYSHYPAGSEIPSDFWDANALCGVGGIHV